MLTVSTKVEGIFGDPGPLVEIARDDRPVIWLLTAVDKK
jgi:hypothetical protein